LSLTKLIKVSSSSLVPEEVIWLEKVSGNRLILDESFNKTIEELQKVNVKLPKNPNPVLLDLQNLKFPPNGELVTSIDEIATIDLDPKKGEKLLNEIVSVAYDESINKFSALEGTAYLMSHSMVITGIDDYIPLSLLTFYFYTRSTIITNKTKYIKESSDPESDSKKDYVKDKVNLLTEYTPPGSVLFIDGPLIGGDHYTFMISAVKKFLDKDILAVYFVKNSASNLVTDNLEEMKGKFNSDMHWAYTFLKEGQRTNFFVYADKKNRKNAKIFCYLKAFNLGPQRVEFHIDTYKRYKDKIENLMNLIYYLVLVQGDYRNPQIRPIAIAEKYARNILHLTNLDKIVRQTGMIPTMNQERFAW